METEQHNGWTNYATWRVQLEVFSDWVDYELSEDKNNSEIVSLTTNDLMLYGIRHELMVR